MVVVIKVAMETTYCLLSCSMSMGFLVEEKAAIVWRGLMVGDGFWSHHLEIDFQSYVSPSPPTITHTRTPSSLR